MSAILKYYLRNGQCEKTEYFNEENKGKTIYEVLKVIDRKPLFLYEHIRRLNNSFKMLNINAEVSYEDISTSIDKLININEAFIGNVKITYNVELKELKLFFIKHFYPTKEMYEEGVKAIFYHGERENPNAKVINNDFRERVTNKIKESNAYEAVLVNNEGYITEGSKSNIFIVKKGVFYTSKVEDVLPGVTRGAVIEVLKEGNFDFVEENLKYYDVKEGDAMFITGTSPDILPVNEIDSIKLNIKDEKMRKLMNLFEEKIKNNIEK